MKLLKTIHTKDLFGDAPEYTGKYKLRKAGRAIIFDNENNIALLHVSKKNYHKLPGGGVEQGEDEIKALKRECKEETGCDIEINDKIGKIIEYRDVWDQKQESHCYLARISGEKEEPDFTQKEKRHGFKLIWVSIDEALDLMKKDNPHTIEGIFIHARDLIFLKQAQKLI